MGIQEEINKLNEATLCPTPPPASGEAPTVPDPPREKILAVVERLVKPWQYGEHYQRFAREVGVTIEQVKKIAEAVDNRRGELAATAEPIEK